MANIYHVKPAQREIVLYGRLIERSDLLDCSVTTKIYEYEKVLYVELWNLGVCVYFGEVGMGKRR